MCLSVPMLSTCQAHVRAESSSCDMAQKQEHTHRPSNCTAAGEQSQSPACMQNPTHVLCTHAMPPHTPLTPYCSQPRCQPTPLSCRALPGINSSSSSSSTETATTCRTSHPCSLGCPRHAWSAACRQRTTCSIDLARCSTSPSLAASFRACVPSAGSPPTSSHASRRRTAKWHSAGLAPGRVTRHSDLPGS